MATISLDVAGVLREVVLLIGEIKNERNAEKEKAKAAHLLVYRALSLHPALDQMRPPTGMLADIDWYTELRSTFTSGIFRKLGQNEHFKRMALLGDTGTRARIMMLLLWIIGHRLSEDSIAKLLSTTLGDALKVIGGATEDLEAELAQLDSVNRVLVSMQKMIKRKLPLPPNRNPFQGRDYNREDEDKSLPRAELWAYQLPQESQYEYDIRRNPVLLLRPLPNKVVIPQTKLTILIIQWAACNFGLGKKVYSPDDIDLEAFWNADPPSPKNCLADWSDSSSPPSSDEDFAFEAFDGLADAPYELMWMDASTEEWVHCRFCSVYPVHGWAHCTFARILLFNAFSASQCFPTSSQILDAVHVADRLSCRLPPDILGYMEQFIIARSFLVWQESYAVKAWKPVFADLSVEERGLLIVFVSALKWDEAQSWSGIDNPSFLIDVRAFLVNPLQFCQGAPDILSLPLLTSESPWNVFNVLPEVNPDDCICGECRTIQSQLPTSLESFRHQYFALTSSRLHGCTALARAWEPTLASAENWLDDLVARIESNFALFPWAEDLGRRMGPAILENANRLGVRVGVDLSDEQLLRFVVMLSVTTDTVPPAIPKAPGPFGLGYVASIPWAADREDYRSDLALEDESIDGPDRVLFVNGGWLYDTVGLSGVSILHGRENLKIVYQTLQPAKFSAVCMPNFRADFVSLFPRRHTDGSTSVLSSDSPLDEDMSLTFVLSNLQTDGFPLFSVASPYTDTDFSAPRGALAVLIRVEILGRVIETFWRPDVRQGSPCEHKSAWGCSSRCSLTAIELIQSVLPPVSGTTLPQPGQSLARELAFTGSNDIAIGRQQLIRETMEEQTRRLAPLLKNGSPMERTRASIVRCGGNAGPVDAMVVLATALRKRVYVLDHRECWECALAHMQEQGRSVGLAIDTKVVTRCESCLA